MSHRYPFTKLTLTVITYSGHILEKGRGGRAGSHILYRSSCLYNIIKRFCLIVKLIVIQIHPRLLEALKVTKLHLLDHLVGCWITVHKN